MNTVLDDTWIDLDATLHLLEIFILHSDFS
jgi:hypothetical protein